MALRSTAAAAGIATRCQGREHAVARARRTAVAKAKVHERRRRSTVAA